MNIQQLAKNALEFLKAKEPNFPKSGVIAGGSLGNLIWEQLSGNVAAINDIDVFVFEKQIDNDIANNSTKTKENKKLFYKSTEKIYWKDYTGFCEGSKTKEFYIIERTENSGLFNFIYYSATSHNPKLVIDSFDINCTQIGYDIESDTFFWTAEFEEFLKDGRLKLTNLGSPHHSVIRILKKRDELRATLDENEIKMAAYAVSRPLHGITRRYFSDKYFKIFQKYEVELSKYFSICKESEISSIIKEQKGIDIGIYTLHSIINSGEIFTNEELSEEFRGKIWHSNDFLFFIRNIQNDIEQYKIWSQLIPLYTYDNYVDCSPEEADIQLLKRIIENIPDSIKNLHGFSLHNQIKIVKKLLKKFENDPTIALALLESKRLDPDIVLDDQTSLLLELSVRTKIVNNWYNLDTILKN